MEEYTISLSKRFLSLRNTLSLSQREAAKLFGVNLTTWQGWENGLWLASSEYVKILEDYELNRLKVIPIPYMCETVRNNLGFNKAQMAKLFGVQEHSWGYWERGIMKPIGRHKKRIEEMFKEIEQKKTLEKAS